jgi:hypothetical protein
MGDILLDVNASAKSMRELGDWVGKRKLFVFDDRIERRRRMPGHSNGPSAVWPIAENGGQRVKLIAEIERNLTQEAASQFLFRIVGNLI